MSTDETGHDFLRSKEAFERHRRALEAVRAASEAKDAAQRRLGYSAYAHVMLAGAANAAPHEGDDPELASRRREAREEYKAETSNLEVQIRSAAEEERRALTELEAASEALEEVTVEPRVEGLKLQFETRKLQATLSAGVVLGTAAIVQLLLPPLPSYPFLLWGAYACFLISLFGSLSDMQRLSIYVENVRISGRHQADEGLRERVASWMLKTNRRLLPLGVLLFALFMTLNLA